MEDDFERKMKTVRDRAVKAVLYQSGAVRHDEELVELEVEDKDGKYLCGFTIDDCYVDECRDWVIKYMMDSYGLTVEVLH